MIKVRERENETRKNYLIRVAIEMLTQNGYNIDTIEYDEAECDAFCLAEDLKIELERGVDVIRSVCECKIPKPTINSIKTA